eukprot:2971937-Pyramimonas_sp.AAC.1
MSAALQQRGLHARVLPGARPPAGSRVPSGFPSIWLGKQSSSFASVGFFALKELAGAVTSVEDYCGDRWHALRFQDPE